MESKESRLTRLPGREPTSASSSQDERDYDQLRDRGLRDLAAGKTAEALEALGRALHLRPDLAEAHLNMGRAFERAGKVEAARHAYLQALEMDLTSGEVQSALAALPPPPPRREDFQVGQVLRSDITPNGHEVVGVKKGGFGAVYIVNREGSRCALKTFQARYLWSDEDRERFEREALTWVMLDHHPHIVSALWIEKIEGFPCLVLEYVPGGDLADLLKGGPLPPARALELGFQFCDGMAYAHSKLGIVHRDIKPSNCLLDGAGSLKITDFGLARAFGEAQEHGLGLAGMGAEVKSQYTTTAGTRQFMAPEQFQPGAELDTRTDIYAFGIMLYEMLTQDLPLIGSIAQAHIEENAPSYGLAQGLSRLILQCVEPEPVKRPKNFGEVREKLGAIYQVLAGKAPPPFAKPSPMEPMQWNNKGIALDDLGRSQEALTCYDRGLEIDPRNKSLWTNKGVALSDLGRYEEALACYDRGLKIDPRESHLWASKGAALHLLGRYEEAFACFDRGLEIDPRNSGLWLSKGTTLTKMNRFDEALACYDEGLEIDPHNSDLWTNKGYVVDGLGRFQEALACYDQGLEVNPRNSALWRNKGFTLTKMNRFDEALACYDRGLEISPRDIGLWANKGHAMFNLRRFEEAVACFERGLEISPRDRVLWKNKGSALGSLRRFEEAVACFERGLEISPRDSGLWRFKAMALEELGRTREAEECAQRARELGGG